MPDNVHMHEKGMRSHTTTSYSNTVKLTAPVLKGIETARRKATLAEHQVRLLRELRDVGIGTNKVEKFLLDLNGDRELNWGKLPWDKGCMDRDNKKIFDCIMNSKITSAEKKWRKWSKMKGKVKKRIDIS